MKGLSHFEWEVEREDTLSKSANKIKNISELSCLRSNTIHFIAVIESFEHIYVDSNFRK